MREIRNEKRRECITQLKLIVGHPGLLSLLKLFFCLFFLANYLTAPYATTPDVHEEKGSSLGIFLIMLALICYSAPKEMTTMQLLELLASIKELSIDIPDGILTQRANTESKDELTEIVSTISVKNGSTIETLPPSALTNRLGLVRGSVYEINLEMLRKTASSLITQLTAIPRQPEQNEISRFALTPEQ